ncbi:hypothetical protein CK203_031615 [Vitis vinifera]|uniref:Retrovirus-related Pol polyprotein from transposon RE2 n=1 Tax=Vitis vinifera TaxID=29760 RepID=A0A438IG35_VITVI|nr:hypothetical protein CK203_031615 [Vitis vinifera]
MLLHFFGISASAGLLSASDGSSLPWSRLVCALGRPFLHLQSLSPLFGSPTYQQDMDLSTYIGRIVSLKEEFLTLMPSLMVLKLNKYRLTGSYGVNLIGLRPNLESVRDQILASPSIPSLDDVFARLLCLSSTQTLSTNGPSDSSIYMDGLLALPTLLSHLILCYLDLNSVASSTSQSITLTGSDYDAYLRYQATTLASVASIAQIDNVSVCFTQFPSLGPWILDSGASDHIFGSKHLFSSITTTSALPTVTLANGSQTIAKGPEYGEDNWHRARLGHPSLQVPEDGSSFFHFVVACVDNAREYFSTPFTFFMSQHGILHQSSCAHTPQQNGDKLSVKATKCIFLGYSPLQKGYHCYSPDTHRYFLSADVTFFEDSTFFSSSESLPISEVLPLLYISPPSDALSHPLQVYHRRHRAVAPPLSSVEVPDDSPPVPPISPTPALSSTDHLPIAFRKGN